MLSWALPESVLRPKNQTHPAAVSAAALAALVAAKSDTISASTCEHQAPTALCRRQVPRLGTAGGAAHSPTRWSSRVHGANAEISCGPIGEGVSPTRGKPGGFK